MQIDIITVFPEMVRDALAHSIVKRATDAGLVSIRVVNLRDYTADRHNTTDDLPYGGGGGMVMKIEPIARALVHLVSQQHETRESPPPSMSLTDGDPDPGALADFAPKCREAGVRVALTDPRGTRFDQSVARKWARDRRLILICGHYEGVDERVRQHLVTDEVSIGDYVLTGGELPALVIVDAVTRLQEGALGDADAADKDSFSEDLLEYPHYTRPKVYAGWQAPEILVCGHHSQIARWRRWQQLRATKDRRPDLFEKLTLSRVDETLLAGTEPEPPENPKVQRRLMVNREKNEGTDGTGI